MNTTVQTMGIEQQAAPEARLWQAVILLTIEEWVSGPLRKSREAEKFLFEDDTDFRTVCESAGMNAEFLRAKLERLRKQSVKLDDCQVAA